MESKTEKIGYIKEVEREWKDHGREVLKNLSTKKIIKEIKPEEGSKSAKDKHADLTNRRFEVEMI